MTLWLILVGAFIAVAAYGSWLAGELGLGPRWRRSGPRGVSREGAHSDAARRVEPVRTAMHVDRHRAR